MLNPVTLPSGSVDLVLDYALPTGYKVNEEAPSSVTIGAGTDLVSFSDGNGIDITGTALPFRTTVTTMAGSLCAPLPAATAMCWTI